MLLKVYERMQTTSNIQQQPYDADAHAHFLARTTFAVCQRLIVSNITAAVACMTLHKFIQAKDVTEIANFDSRVLLSAVVFSSCKMMESQRLFRDVYNVVSSVLQPGVSAEDLDRTYCKQKEVGALKCFLNALSGFFTESNLFVIVIIFIQ